MKFGFVEVWIHYWLKFGGLLLVGWRRGLVEMQDQVISQSHMLLMSWYPYLFPCFSTCCKFDEQCLNILYGARKPQLYTSYKKREQTYLQGPSEIENVSWTVHRTDLKGGGASCYFYTFLMRKYYKLKFINKKGGKKQMFKLIKRNARWKQFCRTLSQAACKHWVRQKQLATFIIPSF